MIHQRATMHLQQARSEGHDQRVIDKFASYILELRSEILNGQPAETIQAEWDTHIIGTIATVDLREVNFLDTWVE